LGLRWAFPDNETQGRLRLKKPIREKSEREQMYDDAWMVDGGKETEFSDERAVRDSE
jgi:hypothetical protein